MKLDEQTVYAHLKFIYGYEPVENESLLINHLITQAQTLIKNFCHINTIPEGAVHPAIDYICGRYFLFKINNGTLVDKEGNPWKVFEAPESSVSMGDVSVGYDSNYGYLTGDNAFLSMVNELADEENFKKEIVHFRKIKWK